MENINPGYARKGAAQSLVEEMENPSATGDSPEVMIPASLFPKGCKEGAEVTIKGMVGKMGSKVGFTPTEVTYEGGEEEMPAEKKAEVVIE